MVTFHCRNSWPLWKHFSEKKHFFLYFFCFFLIEKLSFFTFSGIGNNCPPPPFENLLIFARGGAIIANTRKCEKRQFFKQKKSRKKFVFSEKMLPKRSRISEVKSDQNFFRPKVTLLMVKNLYTKKWLKIIFHSKVTLKWSKISAGNSD